VALSVGSLVGMILIDGVLGSRAEFLNAWSVLERLVGRVPAAGNSVVADHFGPWGELVGVVLANAAIGVLLAWLVTVGVRLVR
jgi:hypothetical protein